VLIEIHKELKLLSLFISFISKNHFKLHKYFLKSFFEKMKDFKNVIFFLLFKLMQALLAKEGNSKVFIKCVSFKTNVKSDFQSLIFRYHSSIFKRIIFQTLIPFLLCK
jgi:hypothetical protein